MGVLYVLCHISNTKFIINIYADIEYSILIILYCFASQQNYFVHRYYKKILILRMFQMTTWYIIILKRLNLIVIIGVLENILLLLLQT